MPIEARERIRQTLHKYYNGRTGAATAPRAAATSTDHVEPNDGCSQEDNAHPSLRSMYAPHSVPIPKPHSNGTSRRRRSTVQSPRSSGRPSPRPSPRPSHDRPPTKLRVQDVISLYQQIARQRHKEPAAASEDNDGRREANGSRQPAPGGRKGAAFDPAEEPSEEIFEAPVVKVFGKAPFMSAQQYMDFQQKLQAESRRAQANKDLSNRRPSPRPSTADGPVRKPNGSLPVVKEMRWSSSSSKVGDLAKPPSGDHRKSPARLSRRQTMLHHRSSSFSLPSLVRPSRSEKPRDWLPHTRAQTKSNSKPIHQAERSSQGGSGSDSSSSNPCSNSNLKCQENPRSSSTNSSPAAISMSSSKEYEHFEVNVENTRSSNSKARMASIDARTAKVPSETSAMNSHPTQEDTVSEIFRQEDVQADYSGRLYTRSYKKSSRRSKQEDAYDSAAPPVNQSLSRKFSQEDASDYAPADPIRRSMSARHEDGPAPTILRSMSARHEDGPVAPIRRSMRARHEDGPPAPIRRSMSARHESHLPHSSFRAQDSNGNLTSDYPTNYVHENGQQGAPTGGNIRPDWASGSRQRTTSSKRTLDRMDSHRSSDSRPSSASSQRRSGSHHSAERSAKVALKGVAAAWYNRGWLPLDGIHPFPDDIAGFNGYLSDCKSEADLGVNGRYLTVVLGKDPSDLGSMVSTLAYAYFLHCTGTKETSKSFVPVPVINMRQDDLVLHPEAVWLFQVTGVDTSNFIFVDQISLQSYHRFGNLKLVLMNHGRLAPHQQSLKEAVIEIVDNAVTDEIYEWVLTRDMQEVGSCSTLIAERFAAEAPEHLAGHGLNRLLLGPMLLDTANLDSKSARCTTRDERMVALLINGAGSYGRQGFFRLLRKMKFDISVMSTMDMLRKDLKKWTVGPGKTSIHGCEGRTLTVAMSTVGVPLWKIMDRKDIREDLNRFKKKFKLDLHVVVTGYYDHHDRYKREILLVPEDSELTQYLSTCFTAHQEALKLSSIHVKGLPKEILSFRQGQVTASRSVLRQILENYFAM